MGEGRIASTDGNDFIQFESAFEPLHRGLKWVYCSPTFPATLPLSVPQLIFQTLDFLPTGAHVLVSSLLWALTGEEISDHLHLRRKDMPRKTSSESYVWTDAKEKLFLEKLDEYLAARGGKQPTSSVLELWATEFNTRFGSVPAFGSTLSQKKERMKKIYRGWKILQTRTGLGYDPVTDTVVCSDETWRGFVKDNKECTHLRYEGLRHKESYYNIFEKNHAAGASGFGSVTMGGGSTPSFEFDFSMDQSGTQPVMEDGICQSIGARRQANTSGVNDESDPSRSRGSTGKRKQRDATDEMTYKAMQEIANHFRGRSQSTTSSDQNTQNLCIVECMNIMKEMSVPQYQRTIMWHYFDAHPQLQRPFCLLDDEDRRGIIASVVTSQMPPPI
ncbi:hypothetical protein TIFTF001_034497 [Ficus carica]|uniref:Myb/SANT-like domain-containing protein n=1 Tax=Ficus carica TaxID=3494 RepID=A0AA88E007_FICCA|nr:hypothetical protein TIFTF001_034497 [Ficus carica]